jgi:hypothetical protein
MGSRPPVAAKFVGSAWLKTVVALIVAIATPSVIR